MSEREQSDVTEQDVHRQRERAQDQRLGREAEEKRVVEGRRHGREREAQGNEDEGEEMQRVVCHALAALHGSARGERLSHGPASRTIPAAAP